MATLDVALWPVSPGPRDVLEVHPSLILGVTAGLIPILQANQSPPSACPAWVYSCLVQCRAFAQRISDEHGATVLIPLPPWHEVVVRGMSISMTGRWRPLTTRRPIRPVARIERTLCMQTVTLHIGNCRKNKMSSQTAQCVTPSDHSAPRPGCRPFLDRYLHLKVLERQPILDAAWHRPGRHGGQPPNGTELCHCGMPIRWMQSDL